MHCSRRDLLKLGLGAAAVCTTGVNLFAADKKKIPIGLQLYSVRNDCQKDLPAVIQAVAKMGYQGVEFAGYYGRKADELRKLLDDNGLKCCGTHTGLNTADRRRLPGHRRVQQDAGQQVPHRSRPAAGRTWPRWRR